MNSNYGIHDADTLTVVDGVITCPVLRCGHALAVVKNHRNPEGATASTYECTGKPKTHRFFGVHAAGSLLRLKSRYEWGGGVLVTRTKPLSVSITAAVKRRETAGYTTA